MKIYFFFIFLLLIPGSSAFDANDSVDLFDILGISVLDTWDLDWDLNMKKINPDKVISSTPNMEAWIDIVGFEGLYKVDTVFYYPGDPKNTTVLKYDVNTYDTDVESLIKTVGTYVINNSVHSVLYIAMRYSESVTHEDGTESKTYHYDYLTVRDVEELPAVRVPNTSNVSVHIKTCNNTFSPKSWIAIQDTTRIKTVINYKNESIIFYDNIGLEDFTNKGYPYINFTRDSVKEFYENDVLRKLGPYYCIHGANFTLSNLTITVYDVYSSHIISNYTEEIETYDPYKNFHTAFYLIVGIILIFSVGVYQIWRLYK